MKSEGERVMKEGEGSVEGGSNVGKVGNLAFVLKALYLL